MGCTILPDGRIVVEATEKNSKDNSILPKQKKLLADTGSPYTFITLGNAEKAGGKPTAIEGDKGCNFGDRYNVSDLEMEIEVEDSKGNKIKKTCKEIQACKFTFKFAMELLIRLKVDGIIGMDQFDSLGADPAKDAEKKRAFLELREDPPPKKEKE